MFIKPMCPGNITKWFKRFEKKYNLSDVHPHKFRHTQASILLYNGVDEITVSKRLGHASPQTTTQIYSHIIKDADSRASDCVADVLYDL